MPKLLFAFLMSMGLVMLPGVVLAQTEDPTAVPEPTTILLLASGLIGLAAYGRKKFFKK